MTSTWFFFPGTFSVVSMSLPFPLAPPPSLPLRQRWEKETPPLGSPDPGEEPLERVRTQKSPSAMHVGGMAQTATRFEGGSRPNCPGGTTTQNSSPKNLSHIYIHTYIYMDIYIYTHAYKYIKIYIYIYTKRVFRFKPCVRMKAS